MKKILKLLMCVVLGLYLINNISIVAKAENEDIKGLILMYNSTDSKYGLYVNNGESVGAEYTTNCSVSYNSSDKTLKLNLSDGFSVNFTGGTGLGILLNNSPYQVDKIIINVSGVATLNYTGTGNNNITGIEYGFAQSSKKELVFEGDGTLNLNIVDYDAYEDRDVYGIFNYGKLTKNDTLKINVNIKNKNATSLSKETYHGVAAYGDIVINDGEMNINLQGKYQEFIYGVFSGDSYTTTDPPMYDIYLNGGKLSIKSITDATQSTDTSDQSKTLLVGDSITLNGETADVVLEANKAQYQGDGNPCVCCTTNHLNILYGTIEMNITNDYGGALGRITATALSPNTILLNPAYNKTQSSNNLKVGKFEVITGYYFNSFIDSNSKPVLNVKVVCDAPYVPAPDPTPTPSSDPSTKDESCEKVIGPTWHWNNDKGICEDYGVVGTSTR